jgi:anti-anti-sigma regulatory factor
MRDHGIAGSAAGLVPSGHLCWAYHDRAEFHARVAEYAADGIAAGQYVEYAGEGSASELRDQFAALAGDGPLRDALDAGLIGIRPVGGFHRPTGDSGVLEPAAASFLADCTEKALAGGYTGFRAVVDATVMARTPGQRDAHARLEYLIDQQMTTLPATTLCAYDVGELGADAVAELACLHPFISPGATPFQLYASPGAAFALAGDIDHDSAALFSATLERVGPPPDGPDMIIDAQALAFIDHRGLRALDEHAAARNRTAVLRTTSPGTAKIAALLPYQALRVETTARRRG